MASEPIRWPVVMGRARESMESYEGGVTLRRVMYRLVSEDNALADVVLREAEASVHESCMMKMIVLGFGRARG
ncbi:hypothetical protein ACIA74_40445 [Streptomyces sp. NPDC051658]|uniref:hypothetical protein n=1 Tax=Streptomyces sp. NPDC051658 TaxID=3365667 RepID=UPI0037B83657